MIITKVIQRGVQHNTKVQYTRQADGNILQAGHRMAASCFQCRGCGQRGHLAKDCPGDIQDESEQHPDSEETTSVKAASVQAVSVEVASDEVINSRTKTNVQVMDQEHKTAPKPSKTTSSVAWNKLASEGAYKTVFCHCESLRSSLSPLLHLTQLAAVDQGDTFFRAIVPPGELIPPT